MLAEFLTTLKVNRNEMNTCNRGQSSSRDTWVEKKHAPFERGVNNFVPAPGCLSFGALKREETGRRESYKKSPPEYQSPWLLYFIIAYYVDRSLDITKPCDICWLSHDVTKIQTKKLSILPRFYFHDALEQLICISYKFSLQKGSWFCDRVRLNF